MFTDHGGPPAHSGRAGSRGQSQTPHSEGRGRRRPPSRITAYSKSANETMWFCGKSSGRTISLSPAKKWVAPLRAPCNLHLGLRPHDHQITGAGEGTVSLRDNILSTVEAMPSLPTSALDMVRLANEPETSVDELRRVIERDPGLTTNVLHLATLGLLWRLGPHRQRSGRGRAPSERAESSSWRSVAPSPRLPARPSRATTCRPWPCFGIAWPRPLPRNASPRRLDRSLPDHGLHRRASPRHRQDRLGHLHRGLMQSPSWHSPATNRSRFPRRRRKSWAWTMPKPVRFCSKNGAFPARSSMVGPLASRSRPVSGRRHICRRPRSRRRRTRPHERYGYRYGRVHVCVVARGSRPSRRYYPNCRGSGERCSHGP